MISVCIPTYNGEDYVKEQIDSIIGQLSLDDEIIISDDSSSDNTVDIIKSYNDSRIKLLCNNHFHSPIYNLENALKLATGDVIFLADQDDIWEPEKVSVCIESLQKYDLIIHNCQIINAKCEVIHDSFYKLNHTRKSRFYNLVKNGYLGCCMCFKKELLMDLLPFPPNLPMHDLYIGNFAAFNNYKIDFIDNKLIKYRRHGKNASVTAERSKRKLLLRINDRITIMKSVLR